MSAASTWLLVVPAWLLLSVVVGLLVGRFIRVGSGSPWPGEEEQMEDIDIRYSPEGGEHRFELVLSETLRAGPGRRFELGPEEAQELYRRLGSAIDEWTEQTAPKQQRRVG